MSTIPDQPASPAFSRLLILLGVLATIAGAIGTLLVAWMLGAVIPRWLDGRFAYFTYQFLFQGLWLLFFVSMFVLGLKLIRSGREGRRHDVVPGLTLYYLGAALAMIGVMLVVFGSVAVGAALFGAGALAVYVEWSTEVI